MRLGFIALILGFSADGLCGDLKIHALGCVLSLPNVSDISVMGSGDVTFSFRRSESAPLQLVTITKYPGEQAWYAKSMNDRSVVSHSKYLSFDERLITVKGLLRTIVGLELTDKKAALLFLKTSEADLGELLDCSL